MAGGELSIADMKIASAFYRGSGLNYSARSDSLRSYNLSLKTDKDLVKYRAENPFVDDIKYSKDGRVLAFITKQGN